MPSHHHAVKSTRHSQRSQARLATALLALVIASVLPPDSAAMASEESDSDFIDLVIAACRAREDALFDVGFTGEYFGKYGADERRSVLTLDYFVRKGQWRANLTFLESPDVPIIPGETNFEFSNDGRELVTYLRPTAQAAITLPQKSGTLNNVHIWIPTEFWLTLNQQPLSEFLAQSRDVIKRLDPRDGAERFSVVQAEGGLIFHIVRGRRFAIRQADHHFHMIGESLGRQFVVTEMKELAPGFWAPSEWDVQGYYDYDKPGQSKKNGSPSHWTLKSAHFGPVQDRALTVEFAMGTAVANNITGKSWQEGGLPDSQEIDPTLWRQAMQQPMSKPKPRGDDGAHYESYRFIAANVAAAALSLAVLLYWRRRQMAKIAGK